MLAFALQPAYARELRVCSDPNNLPFSNQNGEGFENRIAELLAHELGAELHYTWWAQRRGFIRNTLKAGSCDVIIGVPTALDMVATTAPYYRSTYVFVTRQDHGCGDTPTCDITSFDDPKLKTLRIGVQMVGDDYANTPPAHALARRGIVRNVVGYMVYGDYSQANPTAPIVEAVAHDELDVAVVWGPQAGYFARHSSAKLNLTAVSPQIDLPFLPFVFDIALGVRREDRALRDELDAVLARRRGEIRAILADYGVPIVAHQVAAVGGGR